MTVAKKRATAVLVQKKRQTLYRRGPVLNITIEKITVNAKSRRLTAVWGMELP